MKVTIAVMTALLILTACGADGEPVKPTFSTKHTIGYNSVTGPFNKNVISVQFGS